MKIIRHSTTTKRAPLFLNQTHLLCQPDDSIVFMRQIKNKKNKQRKFQLFKDSTLKIYC